MPGFSKTILISKFFPSLIPHVEIGQMKQAEFFSIEINKPVGQIQVQKACLAIATSQMPDRSRNWE